MGPSSLSSKQPPTHDSASTNSKTAQEERRGHSVTVLGKSNIFTCNQQSSHKSKARKVIYTPSSKKQQKDMGRITIFSSDRCPHSTRTRVELEARNIPYTEISVTKYPKKRADMLALSNHMATPQVFFNTRHVGGADETIALLKKWDAEKKRYKSASERYEAEIGNFPDPSNPRFDVPEYDPVTTEMSLPREEEYCVTVPSGRKRSVREVMDALKKILPAGNNIERTTLYKNSFIGLHGLKALAAHYKIDEQKALTFFEHLVEKKIIHKVSGKDEQPSSRNIYRLQCFHTPHILNSYRIWLERVDPDAMRLVLALKDSLEQIEFAMTDGQGTIDLVGAKKYKYFSAFEEAVCELQGVDLLSMNDTTKIAFGINLYNLMIKYAHIKVGVATTDYSRFTYFNNVKFNVGGHVYSFQDWENGILRGNRKAPYVVGLQFDQNDPRLAFMVKNQDCRIHFGLNCGARSCPPVRNFTADNLQEELKVVATAYCEDSTSIQLDPKNNTMHLSQIFSWYRIDFVESKNQLPKALSKYLRGTKQQKLDRMLEGSSSVKVQFTSYDWSNNSRTHVPFDVESLRATKMGLKFLVKSLIGRNSQQEVQAH